MNVEPEPFDASSYSLRDVAPLGQIVHTISLEAAAAAVGLVDGTGRLPVFFFTVGTGITPGFLLAGTSWGESSLTPGIERGQLPRPASARAPSDLAHLLGRNVVETASGRQLALIITVWNQGVAGLRSDLNQDALAVADRCLPTIHAYNLALNHPELRALARASPGTAGLWCLIASATRLRRLVPEPERLLREPIPKLLATLCHVLAIPLVPLPTPAARALHMAATPYQGPPGLAASFARVAGLVRVPTPPLEAPPSLLAWAAAVGLTYEVGLGKAADGIDGHSVIPRVVEFVATKLTTEQVEAVTSTGGWRMIHRAIVIDPRVAQLLCLDPASAMDVIASGLGTEASRLFEDDDARVEAVLGLTRSYLDANPDTPMPAQATDLMAAVREWTHSMVRTPHTPRWRDAPIEFTVLDPPVTLKLQRVHTRDDCTAASLLLGRDLRLMARHARRGDSVHVITDRAGIPLGIAHEHRETAIVSLGASYLRRETVSVRCTGPHDSELGPEVEAAVGSVLGLDGPGVGGPGS